MHRRAALAALLLAATTATGCFGAPWATPPIRASLGAGGRVFERTGPRVRAAVDAPTNIAFRAALEPMQLVPMLADRPFDVGLGWLYEPGATNGASLSGPFLESGWVIFSGAGHRPETSSRWGRRLRPFHGRYPCGPGVGCTRLSLRTRVASIRPGDGGGTGVQLAAQLSLEHGAFARWMGGGAAGGHGDGAAAGGAAWGEGGVGVYAELVRSEIPGAQWWQLSGGISVRVPASVGGFFAICGQCLSSMAVAALH